MDELSKKHEELKTYYGRVLESSHDLKTNACSCDADSVPLQIREIIAEIDDEIVDRFYGCGSPIPSAIEGCKVLDLGCGTGRDVYTLSKLVGEDGFVVGVDMTDEQLDVAMRHVDSMTERFGYARKNVDFKKGYIEDLQALGLEDNTFDVVVSNCVINLSPQKKNVFSEIFRVLKPGGELYFSDVFSGRRVPESLLDDPVLHGECLSGALYIEDFRRMLHDIGCPDYRTLSHAPITIDNPEIEDKVGLIDFHSLTVRAFKLDSLEDLCEDYGQVAVYKGTVSGCPHYFDLDDHHRFTTNKPMLVCGNTAAMVQDTRLGKHFEVQGDRSVHYGPFDCGPDTAVEGESGCGGGSCC